MTIERLSEDKIRTSLAQLTDAMRISELLTANGGENGGMLLGRWTVAVIEQRILDMQNIVIATDESDRLLGTVLTQDKDYGNAPTVQAMLQAWPGDQNSYVYGPACISEEARGQGILRKMYARLRNAFPTRNAILFIRDDNPRSLRAHLHLGFHEVARYSFEGNRFIVLSDEASC